MILHAESRLALEIVEITKMKNHHAFNLINCAISDEKHITKVYSELPRFKIIILISNRLLASPILLIFLALFVFMKVTECSYVHEPYR